jgi:NADH-quinone oxidoreductase subunit G
MLKCTINGKALEVKEGSTIIQAFKLLNEDIAHYCWHPGLSVAGVCRLCMVEIEGNPKLQIACNTGVVEGMVVNNTSEKVKDAVKWGLDFHLINHPLDCPICDQAGECGLQDQYMEFGKYDPEMGERKVKKRKVVDLGPEVVLDSERCILCTRCVRFTEEISKSNELGIFNRGDRSEIGTYQDKPLDNKYSVNTVDICPVGALTAKDFRFKQRVWFLKDKPSICIGCSTGCNTDVYFNREGAWRLKPRYNPEVNGYWMCDEGRETYKPSNKFHTDVSGNRGKKETSATISRLTQAVQNIRGTTEFLDTSFAVSKVKDVLAGNKKEEVALVVTGQQTVEELDALVGFFVKTFGAGGVYHWQNQPEKWNEFDGLLLRGDKNPNTKGLLKVFEKHGVKGQAWTSDLSKYQTVIVAAPEIISAYPDLESKVALLGKSQRVIWLGCSHLAALAAMKNDLWLIPTKTFMEKTGTYINYQGREQKVDVVTTIVESAYTLEEIVTMWQGNAVDPLRQGHVNPIERIENQFIYERGDL